MGLAEKKEGNILMLEVHSSWAPPPTTGSMPGIKAFTAAVFGGIGSIPGALLGGVLLGVIEISGRYRDDGGDGDLQLPAEKLDGAGGEEGGEHLDVGGPWRP